MDEKIKIKCPNCRKEIKVLLRFGETFMRYADTRRACPHCGHYFGIISYRVAEEGQ